MAIEIRLHDIPHKDHRYETVGDWKVDTLGLREVLVSSMGQPDYEFLVALHELVEGWLCVKRGIADEDVTAFDEAYEAGRPEGDDSEPGDHPDAPYFKEHQFATKIERLMSEQLGVDWGAYEKTIYAL